MPAASRHKRIIAQKRLGCQLSGNTFTAVDPGTTRKRPWFAEKKPINPRHRVEGIFTMQVKFIFSNSPSNKEQLLRCSPTPHSTDYQLLLHSTNVSLRAPEAQFLVERLGLNENHSRLAEAQYTSCLGVVTRKTPSSTQRSLRR